MFSLRLMVEWTGDGSSALRSLWETAGGRLKKKKGGGVRGAGGGRMQMKQMKKTQAGRFANELVDDSEWRQSVGIAGLLLQDQETPGQSHT